MSFTLQPLESRLQFDGGAIDLPGAMATTRDVAAISLSPALPSTAIVTTADRQRLLSRLTGAISESLARTLRHSGPDAFDRSLLGFMTHQDDAVFFFNNKQINQLVSRTEFFPQYNSKSVDAVLAHRFPRTLGSENYNVQLPADIDWDTAPVGVNAANFLNALNRHAHWKDLGIAYRRTGDARYAREVVAQLTSWSAQMSTPTDPDDADHPAWALLTAADRLRNWIYASRLLLGTPQWTPAANTLFLARLGEQADFLARANPSSFYKNRTAVHAAALLQAGLVFPQFSDAAHWERKGAKMTFACLDAQFYPDGGHIEQTPFYAAITLNSLLDSYLLTQLNSRTYWRVHSTRHLRRAVEAIFQLMDNAGQLPALSDTYHESGVETLMTDAAVALRDPHLGFREAHSFESYMLLNANSAYATLRSQFPDHPAYYRPDRYALPDSGYYVLRGNGQLIFDAGPRGHTHGHFDLLSFEFQPHATYVADPGSYPYDHSPQRAWAVSTPAHNTISIDDVNHDTVEGARNPKIVVDEFTSDATEARITAHHHAYQSLPGRPVVGRTIWLDRTPRVHPIAIVIDWARSDSAHAHTFTSSFNFNASTLTQLAPGLLDANVNKLFPLRVQTLLASDQTTATTNVTLNNGPDDRDAAQRYATSQTGDSAVFITLLSVHKLASGSVLDPNPAIPPASIALDAPLKKGQPVRIALTMPDGAVRHLVFPPPNLAPL